MELKSLIMGLIFGLGIFAVKSGIGLGYLLTTIKGRRRQGVAGSLHVIAYLLVFFLCGVVLTRISLLNYFPQLQQLFAAGMTLHLISAVLLGGWGIFLLLRQRGKEHGGQQRGWLLLSLPCPVCASVILLESAFILNLFPDQALLAMSALAGGFAVVQLVSAGLLFWHCAPRQGSLDQIMGGLMCLLASYFIAALCIVPQFAQIERIFRLSKAGVQVAETTTLTQFIFGIVIIIAAGYLYKRRQQQRSL